MPKARIWIIAASVLFAPTFLAAQDFAAPAPPLNGDESLVGPGIPLGTPPRPTPARYRFQNGRWWYLSRENVWSVWENGRWRVFSQPRPRPRVSGAPIARSPAFERRFATYLVYQIGQGRLQTAEGGGVALATDEVTDPGEEATVAEAMAVGGIPRRSAQRTHTGIRRAAEEERPNWFQTGSPFGVRFGYGSGFGYSGYGYNNPYGYGPRSGSGGAFSYGFGPFGSVGGQTSARMPGMSRAVLAIGEPPSLGSPSQLEKGPVGGSIARPARRKLGGSAAAP